VGEEGQSSLTSTNTTLWWRQRRDRDNGTWKFGWGGADWQGKKKVEMEEMRVRQFSQLVKRRALSSYLPPFVCNGRM